MQRSPSIHIFEDDLVKVLRELEFENPSVLAKQILVKAKRYKLQDRKLLDINAKAAKQIQKLSSSKRDDATEFTHILLLVRRRQHHKGISLIKEGSKDWLLIREVTKLANSFCTDFNLKRKEGYKLYCEIACKKLKPFSLTRFNSMHGYICHEFEQSQAITHDLTPHLTQKAIDIYNHRVADNGGIPIDYSRRPEDKAHFIKAVDTSKDFNVKIETYLEAQFEGLAWATKIPSPSQLHGDKAVARMNKYLADGGNEKEQELPMITIDFTKLRKKK